METLNKIGGFLLGLVITSGLGLLLILLQVHVIYKVALMYNVEPISSTPHEIVYGLLFIWGFVRVKLPKKDNEKHDSTGAMFLALFGKQVNICMIYLIGWFMAWIFHIIVF